MYRHTQNNSVYQQIVAHAHKKNRPTGNLSANWCCQFSFTISINNPSHLNRFVIILLPVAFSFHFQLISNTIHQSLINTSLLCVRNNWNWNNSIYNQPNRETKFLFWWRVFYWRCWQISVKKSYLGSPNHVCTQPLCILFLPQIVSNMLSNI